jgi:hypothetical protein
VEQPASKKGKKELVTKETWKPMVGLEEEAEVKEDHQFLREFMDCFAFSLHDLEVLKG